MRSFRWPNGTALAIVRQLADASGLQVELEPRPGGGTLARVRLDSAPSREFE